MLDRAFWNLHSPPQLKLVETENATLLDQGVADMERSQAIGGAGYGDPDLTSARVAVIKGHLDEAMATCDKRLKNPPTAPEFLVVRGVALMTRVKNEAGYKDFAEALRGSSTLAAARMGCALYNQGKQNLDDAQRDLDFLTRLRPRFWLGHMIHSQVLFSLRRFEEALRRSRAPSRPIPAWSPT